MEPKNLGKTSTGMQANIAALLSYALFWITGLVFFLIEKENKFVRFHAMQSIIVFGALTVLQIAVGIFVGIFTVIHLYVLLPLFSLINYLVFLVGLILWILLMVKAYQGEMFKLPIAGDMAEKMAPPDWEKTDSHNDYDEENVSTKSQQKPNDEKPKENVSADPSHFYAEILGLKGNFTQSDIKPAYRKAASQYHPDKVAHLGGKLRQIAEEEMKKINEAYAFFRQKYDF